jgi:hypothetical protein
MDRRRPKSPPGLSAEAQRLWESTLATWPVGREETLLVCLRNACFALDRLRAAECELQKSGNTGVIPDRFGHPKQSPLALSIRDSSKQLNDALKMLSLDWEALNRQEAEAGDDSGQDDDE